jgi:hypothetical protein
MFDFKKCVMKIMSKFSSRLLVRVQGKLKLQQKKYIHILEVLLYFSIFKYDSRQPISVADLRWNVESRKIFDIIVSTESVFSKFRFREGGVAAGLQPLHLPAWLCEEFWTIPLNTSWDRTLVKAKGKASPVQALRFPDSWSFQKCSSYSFLLEAESKPSP